MNFDNYTVFGGENAITGNTPRVITSAKRNGLTINNNYKTIKK